MPVETWAVLLMAYGSPEKLGEVAAYYTHIRGGREPSPELVRDLEARYQAIGGRSPLNAITRQQAAGLEAALRRDGLAARVYVGMKHWHPFIQETVAAMAADGVREAVALALAPHYSRMSVEGYLGAARAAAERQDPPLRLIEVRSWHHHPRFLDAVAQRVAAARGRFDREPTVIFSAHSLPQRILGWADPYPRELEASARRVAERVGISDWRLAYQSAGRTPEPWLGPDVGELLEELHREGRDRVLVCPIGFVADHLEVLYDIDIEYRRQARELGMHLERTESLNADPTFVAALADIVRQARAGGPVG